MHCACLNEGLLLAGRYQHRRSIQMQYAAGWKGLDSDADRAAFSLLLGRLRHVAMAEDQVRTPYFGGSGIGAADQAAILSDCRGLSIGISG